MEPTSIDGLVAHCQSARFTGILRMRAREGIGEVWFLSGVADEVNFGTSTADEALERMRKATDATYELVPRLPHPGGGFKRRFPSKGSIDASTQPVTLMRYCEQYALTCTLAVESGSVLVEAKYELGDLVSVETTADDDGITAMLEAKTGTYEFTLPRVELPAGTPVLPPAPSLAESLPPPDPVGFRAFLEAKAPVRRAASNEAEVKRKTVEIARQQKAAPQQRSTPIRPVPRPASASKPDKEEVKSPAPKPVEPKVVEAKKEEPKPVTPVVEEKRETKKEEPKIEAAPPVEEKRVEEPVKPAEPAAPAASEESEEEEEEGEEGEESEESEPVEVAAKAGPPAKRSLTWLVIPVLFAVAIGYLLWTNRM